MSMFSSPLVLMHTIFLIQTVKVKNLILVIDLHFVLSQMDPKLRPSFPDNVQYLEEILAHLKFEEIEEDRVPLGGDKDKKTIPKGNGVDTVTSLLTRKGAYFTVIL